MNFRFLLMILLLPIFAVCQQMTVFQDVNCGVLEFAMPLECDSFCQRSGEHSYLCTDTHIAIYGTTVCQNRFYYATYNLNVCYTVGQESFRLTEPLLSHSYIHTHMLQGFKGVEPTMYTIHLTSKRDTKTFGLFLEKPEVDITGEIFANSGEIVELGKDGSIDFVIPVQYMLTASSQNAPVGLGIKITGKNAVTVDLTHKWSVSYTDGQVRSPPKFQSGADSKNLIVSTNQFSAAAMKDNDWMPTLGFGMTTANGFIGSTWQPESLSDIIIVPNIVFYINTGSFRKDTLAAYTTVLSNPAKIQKFNSNDEAWVRLNEDNSWTVSTSKL